MKLPVRTRPDVELPGLQATVRVERRTSLLLPRLRPGDIALVDHVDLDRATAAALVDAGVAAVLNTAPMISGRFPNLGPTVLLEAGLPVVDQLGTDALATVRDGARVRLDGADLWRGDTLVASGRRLDADLLEDELAQARAGMASQLESFLHNSTEFLRREQDLLLHGEGFPLLRTRIEGRPVVVVVEGPRAADELTAMRAFLREQDPVLIAVQRGADLLLRHRLKPHIVVVDVATDPQHLPSAKALRAARDVVARVDGGAGPASVERLERVGVRPSRLESGGTPEDAALLLADHASAAFIVGVGMHRSLEELLDGQRPGLAGSYLTRLKLGSRLVDARAVPALYAGRVRPVHLFLVLLAGLLALAVAVAVTPVGQEWFTELRSYIDSQLGGGSR